MGLWDYLPDVGGMASGALEILKEGATRLAAASTAPVTGTASLDTLGQSQYNFQYKVFPTDIGMDYVGHYMVININVPTKGFRLSASLQTDPAGNYRQFITPLDQASKVDVLRYGALGGAGVGAPGAAFIPRQTKRIAESIALFIPQGMYWYQEHFWDDISMTELAGKIGVGITSQVSSGLAGMISSATQTGGALNQVAQVMGNPINPAVEVMFSTTALRHFTFDFLFAPRNEQESTNLKEIIAQIKFHGAPEINPNTLGATWIPPAEFDITFFNKGVENRNIARINTCVLDNIEVDYHPSGMFSAFRNGHPVQVRMRLQFKEIEPIHKQRILQGF